MDSRVESGETDLRIVERVFVFFRLLSLLSKAKVVDTQYM